MGAQVTIKNIPEGYQSFISNGRHAIIGDEPIKSKGTDLGFAPTELLLASLALCKAATIRYIARKKGWVIGDVHAELKERVRRDPDNRSLSTKIKVAIKIEGDITDEQRDELIQEANACYVHRMIEGNMDIQDATLLQEEE